jgi:hypothetical protein
MFVWKLTIIVGPQESVPGNSVGFQVLNFGKINVAI